jgi:ABC-type spermidine/putrescine transport system permease subunit I
MNDFLIEPPIGLLKKIINRIHKEERLLVIRRVILFSFTLTASVIGFFPSINMLAADFNQSGFFNFFSLAFSDFSLVTTYWHSFMMTLLETLPAVSIVLFLAVLLTFLQSIKYLTKDVKTIIKATA